MRLLLSTFCLAFLSACAPNVVYHVVNDDIDAKFYDTPCSSKGVLALTGPVKQDMKDKVKNGEVELKKIKEKREFCYIVTDNGEQAFLIDEKGAEGFVTIKK